MLESIALGVAQRIGGRRPLVPIEWRASSKGRTEITALTPSQYKQWQKFYEIAEFMPPYRTVAEVEGIEKPKPITIRINRNCTIKVVE